MIFLFGLRFHTKSSFAVCGFTFRQKLFSFIWGQKGISKLGSYAMLSLPLDMALGHLKYRWLRDVLAVTLTLSHYSVTTFSMRDQREFNTVTPSFPTVSKVEIS